MDTNAGTTSTNDNSGLPETPLASGPNGNEQEYVAQNETEFQSPPSMTTTIEVSPPSHPQHGSNGVAAPSEDQQPDLQPSQSTEPLIPEKTGHDQSAFLQEEDDMGEASEVFMDEPIDPTPRSTSPKRGRRNRAKGPHVSFQSLNKKSYWSSDDDSAMLRGGRHQRLVAARPKSSFSPKPKKPRNKRRMRRVQEDNDGSSSDVEPRQQPPRMSPPLVAKNSPKMSPKPPIAVVRTKGSKNKTSPIPTSISSNQTATTGTNSPNATGPSPRIASTSPALQHLSIEDMEICQRLDDEYENALEERHIGYMARYTSVRQSAFFSVVFMLIFLGLGTFFFKRYADWTIHDSLLFSIYTITTVGYGNQSIPKESGFQSFTILYIFVGIATLTIMVAQVYQCIALEASRAQHSRDKNEMARRGLGLDVLSRRSGGSTQQQSRANSSQASVNSSVASHEPPPIVFIEEWACFDTVMHYYEQAKHFFTYNEYGRSISVLLPFAGLVLIGAVVVGPVEGWNIVESLYFAVVSLTTVGFGDYYPKHVASVWFCILWLPFSVGFMSLFLKNVATFYIRLSAQNINRIERRMRRRVARAKEQFAFEHAEALKRAYQHEGPEVELRRFPSADDSDDANQRVATASKSSISETSTPRHNNGFMKAGGRRNGRNQQQFDALPTAPQDPAAATPVVKASRASLFGSPGEDAGIISRRERILKNSLEGNQEDFRPKGPTQFDSMGDILKAVHKSVKSGSSDSRYLSMRSSVMKPVLGGSNEPMRKPSFALRALVQERFAEIIATDIAGFQSSIEIKENTLSVTIDSLKHTADKWGVPRRARKAFRAVAFEALYFVGEHGLITKGADALFALTPFEFHGLFSPLLAALGDAGTMEDWLASTEVLAEYDLKKEVNGKGEGDVETGDGEKRASGPTTAERLHTAQHRGRTEATGDIQRVNPGNAFT